MGPVSVAAVAMRVPSVAEIQPVYASKVNRHFLHEFSDPS